MGYLANDFFIDRRKWSARVRDGYNEREEDKKLLGKLAYPARLMPPPPPPNESEASEARAAVMVTNDSIPATEILNSVREISLCV